MRKSDWKNALLIFSGLTLFFLTMRSAGLYKQFELRVFNALIHGGLVYYAIYSYNQRRFIKKFNYLRSFFAGFRPSMLAVIAFALFQFFYLSYDTEFMSHISQKSVVGQYLTPAAAAFILVAEGFVVTFLTSYFSTRVVEMNMVETYETNL